jgi:hypothetical protein
MKLNKSQIDYYLNHNIDNNKEKFKVKKKKTKKYSK